MDEPFLKVENSPFNAEQVELLNRLASTLEPEQWVWLSGYLTGVRFRLGQPSGGRRDDATVAGQQAGVAHPAGSHGACLDPRRAMPCDWRASCRSVCGRLDFELRISCMSEYRHKRAEKDGTPVGHHEHAW